MADKNKRVNDRISSKNLISYVCTDDTNEIVETGMGRTLNVSESGIMLETHNHIDDNLNVLLSIGLEENLIDIKGKIVHSQLDDKGKHNVGIQFMELDKNTRLQLSKFIKAFKSS
jgi:c-di-GMP-binding flagellar brake protein YcgR